VTRSSAPVRLSAERGSISIVVAGIATVALIASLAAAQELALPSGRTPADVAGEYAARNGATLSSCSCAAGTLSVTVEVSAPVGVMFLASDDLTVRALARAAVDVPVPTTAP
jgi:hypothetical protein